MNESQTAQETVLDPVCGKQVNPQETQYRVTDKQGTHYFCSQACQQQFDAADAKTKKGFWARYTDRLKDTHCTRTPPECR